MKNIRSHFRTLSKKFCGFTGSARVIGLGFAVLASAISAHAQISKIQQSEIILQPSGDVVEHDSFGTSMAMVGNRMIIGGFNADGAQVGAGAAFIFDRDGNNNWVQTARIFAADGKAEPDPITPGDFRSDSFGLNVAISEDGNSVVVGAPDHTHPGLPANAGAIYVFQLLDGVWTQAAELFSPSPSRSAFFGSQSGFGGLAISGTTIVVGDEGSFNVDVFNFINGQWVSTAAFNPPNDFAFLPTDVAISENTIVVGSSTSDAPSAFSAGVVYVFQLMQGSWVQTAQLAAADATSFANFGWTTRISGNLVAIGAISGPGATAVSGAAYVFANDDGAWAQLAKLTASDGLDFDHFGASVSISGQAVLVGAPNHILASTGLQSGSGYVFQPINGQWGQQTELSASDAVNFGDFGVAVAVFGNTLVVGADLQHPPVEGYAGGEAYVFNLNP